MAATIRAHRVAFLLECTDVTREACAALPTVTLGEVAPYGGSLNWLDLDRIEPRHSRSLRARLVWEHKDLPVSEDLHSSVHVILSSIRRHSGTAKPVALVLTDHGRNLLAGHYRASPAGSDPRRGWAGASFALGDAAARRLRLDPPPVLQVHIEEVTFLAFRTGFGIVMIEATILCDGRIQPTPEVLVEAVHLCCDDQRRASLRWEGSTEEGFHLSDLVRPLFAATRIAPTRRRRVYSYTTVLMEGDLSAAAQQEIGLRLSRHYNYSYSPQMPGTEVYRPFAPVLHAMSLEGAATVVRLSAMPNEDAGAGPGLEPQFLTNWIELAYSRAYLWILLVAFHEYLALLDLAQSAALDIDFRTFTETQASELRHVCDRFLALRLRYRSALVSDVTMHNTFHELLRKVLGLEALSLKAAQDAVEAELRLSRFASEHARHAAESLHRRWAWHGAVVAGALGFLVVMGIARQIAEFTDRIMEKRGGLTYDIIEITGLVLALFIGAAGAVSGLRRLRHGLGEDGAHVAEVGGDHIAHTALE